MASTAYFHGIRVVPGENSFQPTVRTIETAIIGLVGTSSVDTSGKTEAAPVLIRSIEEAESIFGKVLKLNQDTIPRALATIYKYGNFPVVVVNADLVDSALGANGEDAEAGEAVPAAAPAAGSYVFDVETKKAKIKAAMEILKRARGELTFAPKIIIAPSYSSDTSVANVLIDLAQSLRAAAIIDGPNKAKSVGAEIKKGLSGQELERAFIVEPWEEIGDNDYIGSSASAAALIALVDREEGFWVSPSNKVLRNYKPARGIGFSFTDVGSEANLYNAEGIACVIYEEGYRLWGARSIGDPTKPTKFLNVLRTSDAIAESILKSHLWAVDRGITKSYTQLVTGSVNDFLRDLTALGAILGGSCSPSPKNSESFIKDGRVFFQYEFTPVYPAEQVTFEYYITDTRLLGVFET